MVRDEIGKKYWSGRARAKIFYFSFGSGQAQTEILISFSGQVEILISLSDRAEIIIFTSGRAKIAAMLVWPGLKYPAPAGLYSSLV